VSDGSHHDGGEPAGAGGTAVVDGPPPEAEPLPEPDPPAPRLEERFWALGFPVLTVLLALSVPALLITGRHVMLHSTDGALEAQVTDPSAPGWRAYTEPTPTVLVLHQDATRGLVGVTLVSLTGEGAGAILFVPVDTLVGTGAGGDRYVADLAADGEAAVRGGVEQLLGVAPSDVVTLDGAGWSDVVAPVAPLHVENPDDVFVAGDGVRPELRFAKGPLALSGADVAEYLASRSVGESDLNRMVRHEVFWRAWLEAVRRSPSPEPVPGEPAGLARYVRALASARLDVRTLPVQGERDSAMWERYRPLADQARDLVARVVPFPVAGPGRRLRIRLLDGTGKLQHGLDAAAALAGAGGQIDQIGNADSFGVPRTRLELADQGHRQAVEALAAALGVGEVVNATSSDGDVDVVVTLGQDYADRRAARTGGNGGG
jgi:hypothetical protein